MGRRSVLLLAVVVVAAAGAATVFVLRSGSGGSGSGGSAGSARQHAVKACAAADRFDKAVKRNADVDTVNKDLNTARRESHIAEKKSSLYVGLTSGLEALRVAIDHNDAQAARVGIDVVRTECGYVRRSRG